MESLGELSGLPSEGGPESGSTVGEGAKSGEGPRGTSVPAGGTYPDELASQLGAKADGGCAGCGKAARAVPGGLVAGEL